MPSSSQERTLLLIAGVLLLVCMSVWSVVYASDVRSSGVLTVAMLDVGQGDALYIESPTGVQVLVDGGVDAALLQALPGVMPVLDRSINAVIATHPDADHIGGFPELLERYAIGIMIDPGIEKDTAIADQLERKVLEKNIPRIVARRGMVLDLGGGVQLHVLYPDRDVTRISESKTNEGGVVALLTYGDARMLFTADTGIPTEEHLLSLPDSLDSDVLKVGHHGSRYSSSEAFIDAVSPAYALISVGGENTYGHPTKVVLDRLEEEKAEVLRTDQKGTIRCVSDGAPFICAGER